MKSKLIYPMVLVAFAAAGCGGRSEARNAAQQQYETVQEGSAAGVTSTIQGPGETLPPITSTNADTTTAFALNTAAIPPAGTQAQPTQVGALPPPMMSSSPAPSAQPAAQPAPRPVTSAPQQAQQPRPAPAPAPAQPQPKEPKPTEPKPAEPQQTETADATGPATDTGTSTPPPAEQPKEEPPPPPADDTSGTQAEEPPPPPPGLAD